MNKKIFPIFIACIFIFTCGFYFFSRTPAAYVDRALEQIKAERYLEAEKTLEALEKDHGSYPIAIYKGYLAQARKKFKEADSWFQAVSEKEIAYEELYFSRAANAYFEGHDNQCIQFVQLTEPYCPEFSKHLFFQGLVCYLQDNYSEALEAWSHLSNCYLEEKQSWHDVIQKKLFSSEWLDLHIAHCFVEEGDLGSAQQVLEKNLHLSEQKIEQSGYTGLSYLFLALASLKEARLAPLAERDSAYKLVRFYLDKSGMLPLVFHREKSRVIALVQEEIKWLLQSPQLHEWAFSFIHLLDEWKAERTIENLADYVAVCLTEHSFLDEGFCERLNIEFPTGPFHTLLSEKLVAKVSAGISKDPYEQLHLMWETVERLALNSSKIASQISQEVSDEIFRSIHHDTESLERTADYLKFWKELEGAPARYFHFAHSLIGHGEMLWKKEGQEKKGTRLMELALSIVDEHEKPLLLKQIELFLTMLYREAEGANMVRRLSLIYDALAFFHLGGHSLASPESLANHLADADYLFRVRRYVAAQTHAEWVLKFEPTNYEALRLYGLSSFHLGDYQRASLALKKLPSLDEQSHKALMLSKAFSAQPQDHHLAQRDSE